MAEMIVNPDELGWKLAQGWTLIDGESKTKDGKHRITTEHRERHVAEAEVWKNPDWESGGAVHNWKNYISEEIQDMWDTFTDDQKKALAESAGEYAGREEWD